MAQWSGVQRESAEVFKFEGGAFVSEDLLKAKGEH